MADVFYTVSGDLHRMARLQGNEIREMDVEIQGKPQSKLNGIYLGRIVEIQKPLKAAFIDIGEDKPGLLPLHEGNLPMITKGEAVLVQVMRTENPIEDKGVRLTRMISFSKGPLIYTPFKPGLSYSKKLKNKEAFKFDLRKDEGLIVRNWAFPDPYHGETLQELRTEWQNLQRDIGKKPPLCVLAGPDLLTRTLKNLNPSDKFYVDDMGIFAKTKGRAIYSKDGVFDERCEEAWESLLSPEISIPEGGTLYIEETRGLTVIDTNSQGFLKSTTSFNQRAVKEAFHQINFRDLGGKIVIDLVDKPTSVDPLLMGLNLPTDVEIMGLSNMGLLEMIRRRRRLSLPQRLKHQLN